MNPLAFINQIGMPEILVVLLVVLVLFGAKRLPEIGKGLGKGIKEFRDASKGMAEDVKSGLEGDDATPPAETTKKDE